MGSPLTRAEIESFERAGRMFDQLVEEEVTGKDPGVTIWHEEAEGNEVGSVTGVIIGQLAASEYVSRILGYTEVDPEQVTLTANYFGDMMADTWEDTLTILGELDVEINDLAMSADAGYMDQVKAKNEGQGIGDVGDGEMMLSARQLVLQDLRKWRDAS